MSNNNEENISIKFISSDLTINYEMTCKSTDKFNNVEIILYEQYPRLLEEECFFLCKGKKINRMKTLEENNIKNGDVIVLAFNEV